MSGELLIFFISAFSILFGAIFSEKGDHLLEHGKRAQGIIFKYNVSGENGRIYYPVVKFLTDKQEWITQQLSFGSSLKRKEGSKVTVIYDPDNPHSVEMDSQFQLKILPKIFIALGIIGLIIVVLELFDITELIN